MTELLPCPIHVTVKGRELTCGRVAELVRLIEGGARITRISTDGPAPSDLYERNGPSFTSPGGDEYEPASYVQTKLAELRNIATAAIAAMSARPDDERAAVVDSDLVERLRKLRIGSELGALCVAMEENELRYAEENARLRHHAEAMAKVLDPNNTYGVMLDGRYAVDAYRKEFPDFRKEFFNE